MTDVAIPVLGLAVIDSINPSALVAALWLLSQPAAVPRVLAYVAGIALAYLAIGIALILGLGRVLDAYGDALDHPAFLAIQLALGIGLLAYGILAPNKAVSTPETRRPRTGGLIGMVLMGMTITAVEMTTALPYFAAITLMSSNQLPLPQWLPLLLVYNAIFIAPPLVLLALHVLLGKHMQDRFAHWRATLQRGAREAMLWIVAITGFALSGDAISRYLDQR